METQMMAWIAVSLIVTVAVVEAVRRLPPLVGAAGFVLAMPVGLCLPATGPQAASTFSLVKLCLVATGGLYLQSAKVTRILDRSWGRAIGFVILAANILEAVGAELLQGGRLNAAAGLLLILAQASPSALHVDDESPHRDVSYALGGRWVAAYCLWNFTFIYGRHSHGATGGAAALAVVHLVGPLIAMRGRSDRFIQARAVGLTLAVLLHVVLPYPPYSYPSPGWYVPAVLDALRISSLALSAHVACASLARGFRTGVAGDALGRLAVALRAAPRPSPTTASAPEGKVTEGRPGSPQPGTAGSAWMIACRSAALPRTEHHGP